MAAILVMRLTGGASNVDPNASIGGEMSSNAVSATALNNLFDNVDPDEAIAGDTEYRAFDLYNSGDAAATSVEIYVYSQTTSVDTSIQIGHDATNDPHVSGATLETIATEGTAPESPVVTFNLHPTGTKLALPDIPASQACRIWVKRIVSAGAANTSSDSSTLKAQYA